MPDEKKFRMLTFSATLLTLGVIFYNIMQEYLMPDIEGYWQRRLYYERVISKKGLPLHQGKYWHEKE